MELAKQRVQDATTSTHTQPTGPAPFTLHDDYSAGIRRAVRHRMEKELRKVLLALESRALHDEARTQRIAIAMDIAYKYMVSC